MNIIYNESYQRDNIRKAIDIVSRVFLLEEFYDEISEIEIFFNAKEGYNGEKVSQLMRATVNSEVTINIEHYFPPWYKKLSYRDTNAVVFSGNPYVINLLGHRLNRDANSLAKTIIHEFVHCVDGLEEYQQGRRVSWGFTHRSNSPSGNTSAAPNQIGSIGWSYFQPIAGDSYSQVEITPNLEARRTAPPQNLTKLDYIAVGKNGGYAKKGYYQYSENDIDNLVSYIKNNNINNLAIYFHGGLVNENEGAEAVQRVIDYLPPKDANGIHAIGFIWKTGVMETISENLLQVFGRGLGYLSLKILLKILGNKSIFKNSLNSEQSVTYNYVDSIITGKAASPSIDEFFNEKSFELTNKSLESFLGFSDDDIEEKCEALAEIEIKHFDKSLNVQKYWLDYPVEDSISIKDDVYESIQKDFMLDGDKGLISSAKRAILVGKVLVSVIRRLSNGTHHDIHATIVEEIFQQFYVSNIGTAIWGAMKGKANDMWNINNPGGDLLNKLSGIENLKLQLVGHSAGANCIAGLLSHHDPDKQKFKVDNIVLMAPASTYDIFQDAYMGQREKYQRLTIISMNDRNEIKDVLLDQWPIVSFIYPASLLYFISGVLENPTKNYGHNSDHPIIGMTRFLRKESVYLGANFIDIREFFKEEDNKFIVLDDIYDHGDFDNNEDSLREVKETIFNL